MKPRIAIWAGAAVLLLALNFARDLRRTINRYDWHVVEKKTLHPGVMSTGVMEAVKVANMKSEVDEEVEKVFVQEGERVKIGQPLMQLTRTRTALEFEQRKNAYLSSEAEAKKAVRDLGVQRKLLAKMAVSRQQVEDAEANVEKTRAAFQISAQEYEIAKKKIDGTLVRSPINGVVLKLYVTVGSGVNAGKEIVVVGDISRFVVRVKLDELDIQHVHPKQAVEITADAFPGVVLKGVVRSIAMQAERETFAKVEVLIDITDSATLSLKHNLSVRTYIFVDDIPDAIGVPIRSILKKDGDKGWVLARNRLNLIRRRRVVLGKPAGNEIEVLSGLPLGTRVATEK